MGDVAAVVGMRASAVYVYYPTKAELLMTALQRGKGHLQPLVTGVRNLPEEHAPSLLQAQREHIDEWVTLLQGVRAGDAKTLPRFEIQSALMLIKRPREARGGQ